MPLRLRNAGQSRLNRRSFLAAGMACGLAPAVSLSADRTSADVPAFELDEATIAGLQEGMTSGKYSARSLAEKYLARIEAIDRRGPTLRSVIELNPEGLAIADALDKERKAKGPRGPLHGIPVLIKDNIDTADKMATTAGSLAMVGSKPAKDAFLVARLRQAGAVILGKTNLSEWANARCSYSTSGWSGRGGQTRNPYALDRNPCGSSSGSCVAVAANLCAVAVGTETDGSVTAPSSVNGLVGVKPTVGLISRTGIIPISRSQDTAGPVARTVRDAAVLLGVLAGIDKDDLATADAKGHIESDYTKFLDADGLKGAKIGIARNFFGFHDGVDYVTLAAVTKLKKQGAILFDTTELPNSGDFTDAEKTVLHYEMKAGLNAYLFRLGVKSPLLTVADVLAFNDQNSDKELPYFGQDTFQTMASSGPLTSYEYQEALAKCRRITRTEGLDAALDVYKLDCVVAATLGPACPIDLVNGDHWLGGDLISVAAVAGYPHVTVPMGFWYGLPLGLSFVGRPWSEPTLLKLAYAFEQAAKARKPPRFLPTVDLKM